MKENKLLKPETIKYLEAKLAAGDMFVLLSCREVLDLIYKQSCKNPLNTIDGNQT